MTDPRDKDAEIRETESDLIDRLAKDGVYDLSYSGDVRGDAQMDEMLDAADVSTDASIPKVCHDCGERIINAGAHSERCYGKPACGRCGFLYDSPSCLRCANG